MNSLCIHVAHMKVTTFNNQNPALLRRKASARLAGNAPCPLFRANRRRRWNGPALSTRIRYSRASLVDKSRLCQARQLLSFRVDDLDTGMPRARALVNRPEEEPHLNPNTGTNEFSLWDPDGYYVTISALEAA